MTVPISIHQSYGENYLCLSFMNVPFSPKHAFTDQSRDESTRLPGFFINRCSVQDMGDGNGVDRHESFIVLYVQAAREQGFSRLCGAGKGGVHDQTLGLGSFDRSASPSSRFLVQIC